MGGGLTLYFCVLCFGGGAVLFGVAGVSSRASPVPLFSCEARPECRRVNNNNRRM